MINTQTETPLPLDASALRLKADTLADQEQVLADACRQFWLSVEDADDAVKTKVRATIDRIIEQAEDAADLAAVAASDAEFEAVATPIPWNR